eukprot:51854_1
MAASPAYPALQQQEQAPPPVAFDQSTPSVAVIHEPQETQDGENYRDTPQRLGQVVGGGESSEQQQIMVYVEQQNNGYSYHSVDSQNPKELFSFKIRDHKINAFKCGGCSDSCVCCCHLQLTAYILLIIFILFNGYSIHNHINNRLYNIYGYKIYDYILCLYFGISLIINIFCLVGMIQCKSIFIRPQPYITLSYIIVTIVNIILKSIINGLELLYIQVFQMIVVTGFIIWFAWIFYTIYNWAWYFEHDGTFVNTMLKPPKKKSDDTTNTGSNATDTTRWQFMKYCDTLTKIVDI